MFYAIDHACGSEWNDFENSLGNINFYDKFPRRIDTEEDQDEDDDNKEASNYLLLIDIITNLIISSSKLWQDFFKRWIKSIEQTIELDNYKPREDLVKLFNDQNAQFLNFNYTKTLQNLYKIKKVIHIHNRVGQDLIFGHGNNLAKYEEPIFIHSINSSFLNDLLMSFKKNTSKAMKKYSDFFKNLNSNIDKVYSYGFSYSKADSVYIKTIIKKISTNATWYFTKYEACDSNAFRIKKIKLRNYGFKGTFDIYFG